MKLSNNMLTILLVVAVVVSVFGAYMVYDYSHSYSGSPSYEPQYVDVEDRSTGMVALNVIDMLNEVDDNEGIE